MDDRPDQHDQDAQGAGDSRFSRRVFVASGVVLGAAVIWTRPYPFAQAAIGQKIRHFDAAGSTTGPTGPGSTTAGTGPTPTTPTTTGATTTTASTSTAGSSPTPGSGARDTFVLALTGHALRADRRHGVSVPIKVDGPTPLSGTAVLEAVVHRHGRSQRITLGSAPFTVAAHRKGSVRIPLNAAGRSLLAQHGSVAARLVVSAGSAGTRQQQVTLERHG